MVLYERIETNKKAGSNTFKVLNSLDDTLNQDYNLVKTSVALRTVSVLVQ